MAFTVIVVSLVYNFICSLKWIVGRALTKIVSVLLRQWKWKDNRYKTFGPGGIRLKVVETQKTSLSTSPSSLSLCIFTSNFIPASTSEKQTWMPTLATTSPHFVAHHLASDLLIKHQRFLWLRWSAENAAVRMMAKLCIFVRPDTVDLWRQLELVVNGSKACSCYKNACEKSCQESATMTHKQITLPCSGLSGDMAASACSAHSIPSHLGAALDHGGVVRYYTLQGTHDLWVMAVRKLCVWKQKAKGQSDREGQVAYVPLWFHRRCNSN